MTNLNTESDADLSVFGIRTAPDEPHFYAHRRKLDQVLRWFRSCAVCESALPPIDLLCARCWSTFDNLRNRGGWLAQPGYPFKVYSLLTWTDENAYFVKPFIYALKGGYALGAAERLAQLLTFERRWPSAEDRPVFLYPPSSGQRADHAALLSSALGLYWQSSAYRLDRPFDQGMNSVASSQKLLDAASRSERRFETVLGSARFERMDAIRVFCDDVITSGSTAKAARTALGEPERFEVWTFVCRPKLAASRAF